MRSKLFSPLIRGPGPDWSANFKWVRKNCIKLLIIYVDLYLNQETPKNTLIVLMPILIFWTVRRRTEQSSGVWWNWSTQQIRYTRPTSLQNRPKNLHYKQGYLGYHGFMWGHVGYQGCKWGLETLKRLQVWLRRLLVTKVSSEVMWLRVT